MKSAIADLTPLSYDRPRRGVSDTIGEERMAKSEAHPLATGDRIQSVCRALTVLDTLAAIPDGQTAKGVALTAGLTLATTYHLLNTLAAAGYASRDPVSRLFTLGPRIPHLHQAFLARARPTPSTRPFLRALRQTTGTTVTLSCLFGDEAVMVDLIEASDRDGPAGYIGYALPAHLIAAGRVLLAWAGPGRLATYLKGRYGFSAGPYPAADSDRLTTDLAQIRATGYAVDSGGSHLDICCLAAPILLASGEAREAVAIITNRERFQRDEPALRAALLAVTHAASAVAAASNGAAALPVTPMARELDDAARRTLDIPA